MFGINKINEPHTKNISSVSKVPYVVGIKAFAESLKAFICHLQSPDSARLAGQQCCGYLFLVLLLGSEVNQFIEPKHCEIKWVLLPSFGRVRRLGAIIITLSSGCKLLHRASVTLTRWTNNCGLFRLPIKRPILGEST